MKNKEVPDCSLKVIQNQWKYTTVFTDNKTGVSKNTEVIKSGVQQGYPLPLSLFGTYTEQHTNAK